MDARLAPDSSIEDVRTVFTLLEVLHLGHLHVIMLLLVDDVQGVTDTVETILEEIETHAQSQRSHGA